MYNKINKRIWMEDYLNRCQVSPSTVSSTFNALEKYEEIYQKDVCEFIKNEIDDFYISLQAKSKERLGITNTILKDYKIWCLNNNFCHDTNIYFDKYTTNDFKEYIGKGILQNKYIGQKTLYSYLKEIENPCDKLLLLLLYNGISGKELCEVVNLHINQVDGQILHLYSGRNVKVDTDIINLIYETNNTYVYYSYEDQPRKYELSGERVFKQTKGGKSKSIQSIYHRFTNKLATFQKMFDNPELTIKRIVTSGMLNALYINAKENTMDLDEFIKSETAKPILEVFSFNRYPTKVLKLFGEYIEYMETSDHHSKYFNNYIVKPENEQYDNYTDKPTSTDGDQDELEAEYNLLNEDLKKIPALYKESYVKIRLMQSTYRKKLLKKHSGKCMLCSINNDKILVASHIKAFCDCENKEHYDTENGLLLCANHDKLFDQHLISFDNNGKIVISPDIDPIEYSSLNISNDIKIMLSPNAKKYMLYHLSIMSV